MTFSVLHAYLKDIILVSEEEMIAAAQLFM